MSSPFPRQPMVTVVMPAFNSERFITPAVSSILNQSLEELDLLVIDDGSTDGTVERVQSFEDPRLRLLFNERNLGLAATRNRGVAEARGRYVAWLDSDDVALPSRLATQVSVLERDGGVAACGTWGRTLDLDPTVAMRYPRRPGFIRARMLFDNPFLTSSVMVRASVLAELPSVFREEYAPAEDYDLWERLPTRYSLRNVPRVLVEHRQHEKQVSNLQSTRQRDAVERIQSRQLGHLGIQATERQLRLHVKIGVEWCRNLEPEEVLDALEWLEVLAAANDSSRLFPQGPFKAVLAHRRALVRSLDHRAARLLARARSALQ